MDRGQLRDPSGPPGARCGPESMEWRVAHAMQTSCREHAAPRSSAPFRADRHTGCVLALVLSLIGALGTAAVPAWGGERIFMQRLNSEPTSLDPAKTNAVNADQVM